MEFNRVSKPKSITLSVHRAIIRDAFPWTFAELLEKIKLEDKSRSPVIDRSLLAKTAVKFPSFPKTNLAVAAQFALYEEGAEKSTISLRGMAEPYSTAPTPPPKDAEFLEHEVAILVDGNYMIACGLGKRQGLLVDAIEKIAEQCGIKMPPRSLGFTTTPNKLTVEKIRSVGVKLISFDAANFVGSLDIPTQSLIGSIFGSSAGAADFQKNEMVAQLSIHPKRLKKSKLDTIQTPKNEWLERTAVRTFEDEDVSRYTIILEDGTEWKEGDLKLTRSVNVARDGSSFSMPEALQAMLNYLEELRVGGHLV